MSKKVAILGVCNTRNVLEATPCKSLFNIVFYGFQTNFVDITNEGLSIPLKDFFRTPIVKDEADYAEFTRRTMFCDLNKTALKTIESTNPDFFVIDLSSLAMRTYEIAYKNKKVYSCNAYSPNCYEKLKKDVSIDFAKVELPDTFIEKRLEIFADYLKENWNLSKLIIFDYTKPGFYIDLHDSSKVLRYKDDFWGVKQQTRIKHFTDFFIKQLADSSLKVFQDADLKVCRAEKESAIPSMFHTEELTKNYQSLLFRKFVFNDVPDTDILKAKNEIIRAYNLFRQ